MTGSTRKGIRVRCQGSSRTAIDSAARTRIAKANANWVEGMKRRNPTAIVEYFGDARDRTSWASSRADVHQARDR
jgi:hypothetical protein